MKGIYQSSPYSFRSIGYPTACRVAGAEAMRKCIDRMGRTDYYHIFVMTNSKSRQGTVVFFCANRVLGYVAIKVVQNDEIVYERFEQNEEELKDYNKEWSNLTKTKYLLQAWA